MDEFLSMRCYTPQKANKALIRRPPSKTGVYLHGLQPEPVRNDPENGVKISSENPALG